MIGQVLSHYKIIKKLGEGGMGVVYQAEDLKLKRIVALKFLAPSLTTDAEAKRCFIDEAQAASALDHPNICTIYEIDETAEGQLFIAMAYYQGETLKEKIERGPASRQEAMYLVRQLAEGLAKAHDKGIVHRDVKPANLMVTEDRVVKILDFGVAKFHHEADPLSEGALIGTPAYMSPEQALGQSVDHRSDIWSVGVILFEMLTLHLPFSGNDDHTLMRAIIHDPPATLQTYLGDAYADLQSIMDKMLTKNPHDRYPNMRAFIKDLEALEHRRQATLHTQINLAPQTNVASIAILPFDDLSAEKDQEYFCDGLAEEIINHLSQIKGLRVASRNATFQFKGKNIDVSQIGQILHVQKALEGSLRKAGNRIRIAVRLINTADGFLLWADEYQRELADIFDIQDEISRAIVKNLEIQLTGTSEKALMKRYTDNVEAYSSYLRGRFYWNKRTPEAIRTAIDYFQAAINMDQNYALAYAGLADAYIVLGLYGRSAPMEVMPQAIQAAEKALKIDEL